MSRERESDREDEETAVRLTASRSGGRDREESSCTTGEKRGRESQSTISGLCLWRWTGDRGTELDAARSRSCSVGAVGVGSGPVGRTAVLFVFIRPFAFAFARSLSLTSLGSRLGSQLSSSLRELSVRRKPRNGNDGRATSPFVFRPFDFFH